MYYLKRFLKEPLVYFATGTFIFASLLKTYTPDTAFAVFAGLGAGMFVMCILFGRKSKFSAAVN